MTGVKQHYGQLIKGQFWSLCHHQRLLVSHWARINGSNPCC